MKRLILVIAAIALSVPAFVSDGHSFPSFLNGVNATCSSSFDCGICHIDPAGGGPLTTEGTAWSAAQNDCIFCPTVPGCAQPPVCTDADSDGFFAEPDCGTAVDCDDSDPNVNPGATEVCDNGIDDDCDGLVDCDDPGCTGDPACAPVCTDADGDGYFAEPGCGTTVDCNDNDPNVNPGAVEVCDNNIDDDCDGLIDCDDTDCSGDPACAQPPVCTDADGDGYFAEPGCGTSVDCNDSDPNINPGAVEVCDDGIDNDCDQTIDCADPDCTANPDCAPANIPERCNDGRDNDGDRKVDCADPDCYRDPDCPKATGKRQEGKRKTCSDGIDNDDDGLIDCDDPDCIRNRACKDLYKLKHPNYKKGQNK